MNEFNYLSERTETNQSPSEGGPVLIYNRIPKTGSTSLMNVAYNLHAVNKFRVVQVRSIIPTMIPA